MKLHAMIYVPEEKEEFQIEIYDDNGNKSRQVAEVFKEEGVIKIEFYNNPFENKWRIDLNYLIEFLEKTSKELQV